MREWQTKAAALSSCQKFFRPLHADLPFLHQLVRDALNGIPFGTGGDSHLPSVERHVPALDAVGTKGTQRGKILGQAHRGHHFTQFSRAGYAKNFECHLRRGMDTRRATDNANRQRQFESTVEESV